ncbi:MAG: ribonuclease HII [Candidatus Pacearchaeota archaeon]|nr:ribonuclease HII [Candidatus Pacearchaeota archaeon]
MQALGYRSIAGVDEAGRGPLAGPVVASAVCIARGADLPLVRDSKRLSAKQREELFALFLRHPRVSWGIGRVSNTVIDRINIHRATLLAMSRAVASLSKKTSVDFLLVDGIFRVPGNLPQQTVIKGDELIRACAAASIIAKVVRDRLMTRYHKRYPEYGFSVHKGYGTALHLELLRKYGPSKYHRMSFAPLSS